MVCNTTNFNTNVGRWTYSILFFNVCCISAINQLNYKVKWQLRLDFKAPTCFPYTSLLPEAIICYT